MLNAYLASVSAGAKHEEIGKKMMHLSYPKMRMEIERGINECTLINDSYNSDIESISNALNYIKNLENNKSRTLIISDFFGLKQESKEVYISLKNMIKESRISKLILIGEEIIHLKEYLSFRSRNIIFITIPVNLSKTLIIIYFIMKIYL